MSRVVTEAVRRAESGREPVQGGRPGRTVRATSQPYNRHSPPKAPACLTTPPPAARPPIGWYGAEKAPGRTAASGPVARLAGAGLELGVAVGALRNRVALRHVNL